METIIWMAEMGNYRVTSSNMNEVNKTVLNFLLFFYEKILHTRQSTKKHKNSKKITKQKHKTQK